MEKAWFYEILFFQVVIVIVKDKNRFTIKDTMSSKIDMVYIFWLLFFFSLPLSFGQSLTLAEIREACSPPQRPSLWF